MRLGPCVFCNARQVILVLPICSDAPAQAECRACGEVLDLPGPVADWRATSQDDQEAA